MVTTRAALQAVATGEGRHGLRLARHFTSEGVHPYDELEWELRDAVINDWRTGEATFEQRDVEFPVSWSMNATTIVAQKYFRGPLGTPQRERSVKQMIDRVADTITGWGREDGYFADDDAATIFNEELKHLLVNQKAAFNSPVWFNVGVEESPQCSACQPWDALVSTPEGLVPIGELVDRDAVGAKVYDAHGVTKVVATKHNGLKHVLRIHLTSGAHLDVTPDHLVWRSSGSGSGEFVEAGRLQPGDRLEWHRTYAHGAGEITEHAVAEAALAAEDGLTDPEAWVPESLYGAPLPVVGAYLRALFAAGGGVRVASQGTVVLDVASEDLVRGVQALLARFGIFARVSFDEVRSECWRLSIGDLGDRVAFRDEIGFVDARKAVKLEASLQVGGESTAGTKQLTIEAIEDLGVMDVYDIQTDSGEYLSGNLRVHNCFILSVEDTMGSILNWYVEEGTIFKGGSGSGVNLSKIRSSKERLSGGGEPSGPVSFMRGADASAGTIRSGGKTRRAAKMVILDVNHPDVEEFIWCKAREEAKVNALREAGFDMDLDGPDYASIQYQNANNSVRVTDEFMHAVEADRDFDLVGVTDGEVKETVKARALMRQIAQAAWECADPGMQYDTTINDWHTTPNAGRINGSNPCFTGETLVDTADGAIPIEVLAKESEAGNTLPDVLAFDTVSGEWRRTAVLRAWQTKRAVQLVEVTTEGGLSVRCTPDHRFLTDEGRWEAAEDLTPGRDLRALGPAEEATLDRVRSVVRLSPEEPVPVYDLTVEGLHNFAVTSVFGSSVCAHNCSEYMHLDNSACNLASLNLRKFEHGGVFDVEAFQRAVEIIFTAQEIIVGNSSYPTEKIGENARAYRQLGLGYANLGGLLLSQGIPYDSDEGRAWAGAITALMTGHAYRTSAELARVQGPFDGYANDRDGMLRVIAKHKDAAEDIEAVAPTNVLEAAKQSWADALQLGGEHGIRNAQASVLAPTGCLVGGTLVPTERGLVRLDSLGDPAGAQWQVLGLDVATDEGPREATQFYVNGLESVVTVDTARGYRVQGTPKHRIKVVQPDGSWVWKRFGDLDEGDTVPLALDQLIGEPQEVRLPPLAEASERARGEGSPVGAHPDVIGEWHVTTPRRMTPELAEFVGYFMGAGALQPDGIRLRVDSKDFEVVEHLARVGKELFNLGAHVTEQGGCRVVVFHSVRAVQWWQAVGFGNHEGDRIGKVRHIPDAVLQSNDRAVYAAFLRGVFEAGGSVSGGYPRWSTTSHGLIQDVQALLLALGYPTTRTAKAAELLVQVDFAVRGRWAEEIGFLAHHKQAALSGLPSSEQRLGEAFVMDTVASIELGEDELTYDLSVPDNVTYVANGFISHNTIGLMMDCDTTGVEPDLGLVKMKKLVGGGSMRIINRTVPAALEKLGYQPEQIEAIVNYIDEHSTIEGAPALREEHLPVFDCAMGDRSIAPMGHVRMISAVQPFLSGAVSKTVNVPESATVEDVEEMYIQGWKLGLKAVAIYRDNCKAAQPLSIDKKKAEPAATAEQAQIVRRRLPKQRPSQTFSFTVGDAEGYLTAGEYPGNGLGEIFVKLGKQGSTLSGVMDAFAISVSLGLQYGVPLEAYVSKFTNMRFEPAGLTDDSEVKFASSIVDYIFRRLAIEYLPAERRHELGIYTLEERNAQLDAAYGAVAAPTAAQDREEPVADAEGQTVLPIEESKPIDDVYGDAPMCYSCGVKMIRAGSCHVCQQCGTTSGCS
jgi:ribonucleoside-diphosphate reductase alpha chain